VLAAALAVTASSGLAVAIALLAFPAASAATAAPPSCRDALLWPFTAASPWNTPLGASAVFVPARLFDPADPRGASARAFSDFHSDDDYVIATAASDPLVTWFDQGHWGGPATEAAYCSVTGRAVMQLHFPANRTVQMLGNNNAAGLLQPDNRTMLLMQPLYVCEPGAPVLAEASSPPKRVDIFNDTGTLFGHGGSGLSAVGGAIRLGELLPGAPPIRHALKLELFANMFYFRPPDGNRSDCYTWPAIACDGYAFSCATQPLGCYNGTNPLVRPGALLAVPPAQAPALSAKLATAPARALLAALSTYGGYLVDDTYWVSVGRRRRWPPLFARNSSR